MNDVTLIRGDSTMTEKVLWTISEAAERLSVSKRTIQRLVDQRILPTTRILGCVRLPVQGTLEVLQAMTSIAAVETNNTVTTITGDSVCRTDAKIRQFGGPAILTQAAAELDALLARRATGKPKTSKRSGVSKPINRRNGENNRNGTMTN